MVDTGLHTMTGGRIKRVREYIGDETFMLTYGDGVSTVDLEALLKFHKSHGKIATISGVNIGQRFGVLDVDADGAIHEFREKSDDDGKIVNGQLMVYRHDGFWKCMDTQRDRMQLENMWQEGDAPWKIW